MARIIYKERHIGGYKYTQCPRCNHEFEIEHPMEFKMPYCSTCGKIILDAAQNYCCWCGEKIEEQ